MKAPWSIRSSSSHASASSDAEAQSDAMEMAAATPGMQRRFTASSSASTVDIPPLELKGVERFKYIVNAIIIANRMRRVGDDVPTPPSPEMFKRATRRITQVSDVAPTVPSAMVNALVPRLRNLAVTSRLDAHNALVKDIQFSPDGKLLATARWVTRMMCRLPTRTYRSDSSWDKQTLLLNALVRYKFCDCVIVLTSMHAEWLRNSPDDSLPRRLREPGRMVGIASSRVISGLFTAVTGRQTAHT